MLEKSQGAIKPWEVGQFTLAEALNFLEDPKERGGGGIPHMNDMQLEHELKRWEALTPLEKLREARY